MKRKVCLALILALVLVGIVVMAPDASAEVECGVSQSSVDSSCSVTCNSGYCSFDCDEVSESVTPPYDVLRAAGEAEACQIVFSSFEGKNYTNREDCDIRFKEGECRLDCEGAHCVGTYGIYAGEHTVSCEQVPGEVKIICTGEPEDGSHRDEGDFGRRQETTFGKEDSGAAECCLLRHSFSVDSENYVKGEIIGAPYGDRGFYGDDRETAKGYCPIADNGYRETPDWGWICTIDSVQTVMDWMFWIITLLSVLFIMVAAGMYITSGGSTERMEKAQKTLIYALVGLLVGVSAKFIPVAIKFFLGFY